ncbi:MAG: carbon-nitrogen hydrolase family protein [Myxococcales bacterium]|nr:carbon-nitrogen hydrolase family protein [Myxococcales bacterium]
MSTTDVPAPRRITRVAAVQMSSQIGLDANLARLATLVGEAASRGAQLVLLPENFARVGDEEGKRAIAEHIADSAVHTDSDGPIVATLRTLAREHGVWLVAGGFPEKSEDPARPYNTCAVFAPDGKVTARYRKIHLFDVDVGDGVAYLESAATSAGTTPIVAEAAGLRVGLSVCYDLRFPELYRRLVDAGAQLLVVPAAFTLATGKDHWHVLLRARAIESQSYVVAAAQWGRHGARTTYGKSCVIDPWGDVIAQASEGEGIVVADVDLSLLEGIRRRLPSLRHRVL